MWIVFGASGAEVRRPFDDDRLSGPGPETGDVRGSVSSFDYDDGLRLDVEWVQLRQALAVTFAAEGEPDLVVDCIPAAGGTAECTVAE